MRKSIEYMWRRRNRVAYFHFYKDVSQKKVAQIIGCCEKTVWNDVQALREDNRRKWALKEKIETEEREKFVSEQEKYFELENMLEEEKENRQVGNILSEWF